MKDQFLYETFIPATTIIIVAFLCAEFIGRAKHIGRFYSFFMMLGLIPGIIGLIFSPPANKNPTKANSTYTLLGIFLIIAGGFGIFQDLDNITFIHIFVSISFLISAFYCFDLSKGNIVNKEPKFYFSNTVEKRVGQVKNNLDNSISNLKELKDKGILTDEEYREKVQRINTEKIEQNLKSSVEYSQLKSLLDAGVLTKREFEEKVRMIEGQNDILKEHIKKYLSKKDLHLIKRNYIKNNKYQSSTIRNKLEDVLKIKTSFSDNDLIEIVINELEKIN